MFVRYKIISNWLKYSFTIKVVVFKQNSNCQKGLNCPYSLNVGKRQVLKRYKCSEGPDLTLFGLCSSLKFEGNKITS